LTTSPAKLPLALAATTFLSYVRFILFSISDLEHYSCHAQINDPFRFTPMHALMIMVSSAGT
jgi:hypothetical protein